MTTLADGGEIHPLSFVTVKVYVPATIPVIVVVIPSPTFVIGPGIPVITHFPDDGKPLRITDPVATSHVGCVIAPIIGAAGTPGCSLITTDEDGPEIQPAGFLTLNV